MLAIRLARAGALVLLLLVASAPRVAAQPLGTFRWQLQPFCNVLTLNITLNTGVYTLDGWDDQCGAGQRASAVGTAFLNPDGSIGIGLTTVVAPGGTPVHVDARVNLGSLGGTWRDSAGNAGSFAFMPGPGAGGALRPVAANGIAPGSITAVQLAPSVIGGGQINPSEVQTRVSGTCPAGQYLRGIHPNGSVMCEPFFVPAVTTTVDDISNSFGEYTSIAIGADGLPVISRRDFDAEALRVTKCGNAACTAGNVSTTLDDTASNVGAFSSIAIGSDGLPVISYHDGTALALRVTHCGNAACTAGEVSTIVDAPSVPAETVGFYTSIAIGWTGCP